MKVKIKKAVKDVTSKIFGRDDLNILEFGVGIFIVMVAIFAGLIILKDLFFWFLEQMIG